jgi:hypothetical protein
MPLHGLPFFWTTRRVVGVAGGPRGVDGVIIHSWQRPTKKGKRRDRVSHDGWRRGCGMWQRCRCTIALGCGTWTDDLIRGWGQGGWGQDSGQAARKIRGRGRRGVAWVCVCDWTQRGQTTTWQAELPSNRVGTGQGTRGAQGTARRCGFTGLVWSWRQAGRENSAANRGKEEKKTKGRLWVSSSLRTSSATRAPEICWVQRATR